MLLNKLKLNKDKTELLVISSLHRARPPLSYIHVCDERVPASPRAGNIIIIFFLITIIIIKKIIIINI